MLSARPLYDTQADAEYFEPPSVWGELMRALERRFNVLVVGGRGVGKTSLLRQTQLALRVGERRTDFIDATSIESPLALSARIRDGLAGRPSPIEAGFGAVAATVTRDPTPPPAGASRALYQDLQALGEIEATTIFVDASGSAEAVYHVFGRMRDVLWQLDHQWVVAVDETDRSTVQRPPADSFFDVTFTLEPMATNQIAELLGRRAANEVGSSAIAYSIVHGGDPARQLDARGQLLERAVALGRPHGMLMAELLDLGQASPSDEALLVRLGVTRPRATQILRDLLARGLVSTATEKPDGPGRPRTVYLPNLEAA